MSTKIHLSNRLRRTAAVVLAAAFFVSAAILAEASSPFDIEFPIPELGNCANKTECRVYCDNSDNEEACQAFAAKHGLGPTRQEVDDKLKAIEKDGGPGGCAKDAENPRSSCGEYCGKRENMRECVAYAKEQGLIDERELAEAEKVIKALDSGVKLPAACTDERSCKATCEEPKDVATARQCFAFAEAAGLLPPGVTPEKAEKMFKAIEEGRAPFKSLRDFEQCEDPPTDEIFEKCINFALENDLIPPEEAEIIKKTGGKGPGGCRGKEQCEKYCEEQQDECFAFAEEHDLVRAEDRERMREGMGKFKEALDNAPPEVAECLKQTVGAPVLDQIAAGTKPPSRNLGEKMRECFEQFFSSKQHEQFGEHFRNGEGESQFSPPGGFAPGGEDHMMGGSEGEGGAEFRRGAAGIEKRMMDERFKAEGGGQYPYPPQGEYHDGGSYEGREGNTYRPPAGYEGGTGEYRLPEGVYQKPPVDYQPSPTPTYEAHPESSGGYYVPPSGGTSGSYVPPPSGESAPPPPPPPPAPSSLFFFPIGMNSLLANVISILFGR